jgi:DNA polymerase III sliding clamp (beta) subunit (PCNA family)
MQVIKKDFLDLLDFLAPVLKNKQSNISFVEGYLLAKTQASFAMVKYDHDFTGAIRANDLLKTVKGIKAKEFEMEGTETQLVMTSKGAKASKGTEVELNFDTNNMEINFANSIVDTFNSEETHFINLDYVGPENDQFCDLIEGIYSCMFSASTDINKETLTCVRIEDNNVYCLDGVRVSWYKLEKPFDEPVMFPADVAPQITKYQPDEIGLSKAWVFFTIGEDVIVGARRVFGKYPNVSSLFEQEFGEAFELPVEMKEVLDAVEALLDEEELATKVAKVQLAKGLLTISVDKPRGKITEKVEIDYSGEDLLFGVNTVYLRQILKHTNKVRMGNQRILFDAEGFKHIIALSKLKD